MERMRKGIATAIIAGMMFMTAAPVMAQEQEAKEEPNAGTQVVNAIGGVLTFAVKITGQVLGGVGTMLGNIGKTFSDTAEENEKKSE